jgi:monovalent cation:H+ antiporter-2, CPA2 family
MFIELGLAVIGLALLARIANRFGLSAIPLYLLAGLIFGNGGLAPLRLTEHFVRTGADIGVLLLLFMLGLEYTAAELKESLRAGFIAGLADFVLNFTPGFLAALMMRWTILGAMLLGGITYISSSGVIAKVLTELHRFANPETKVVLGILVFEDLAMAAYLPIVGALLAGGGSLKIMVAVLISVTAVAVILLGAARYGEKLSRVAAHESDEVILLTIFGAILLVAGIAQHFQVSAAIGAFLVGIAVSGPIAQQSHRVLAPLRDLFAATFFFFFGLEIDPASLLPALPLALLLAVVTSGTKLATGYWSAGRLGIEHRGRLRAGLELIARGEFSIVIAGLGGAMEPGLGPLSAAYVLLLAVAGPLLARAVP